jgi:hypothetical protein
MMINKSAPRSGTALSHDHYTSIYSDQQIQQQDGDQDLYSQVHDHLFIMKVNKLVPGWDQELHSHTIITLHYIAINKFSSMMGIRIFTHREHDHLFGYDDQQIGTRMGLRTALSHDYYTSLYSDQQTQQQDRHKDWHSQGTRSFILL